MRGVAPQPVPHRGIGVGDGVVTAIFAVSPAIEDDQYSGCFFVGVIHGLMIGLKAWVIATVRHFTLSWATAHCCLYDVRAGLAAPRYSLYTEAPATGLKQEQRPLPAASRRQPYLSAGIKRNSMALFLEFLAQQWIQVAALLALVAMLVFHESRKGGASVSPQQAINQVNAEDGIFLDLRDAAEFNKGHIVDAVNIPATKLPERMVELEKYKEKPVVLVCKMGQQSGAAGKQLRAAGYTRVSRMAGGMIEWGNLQLPVVS